MTAASPPPPHLSTLSVLLLALAAAAGYVDAVGFLLFGHIFVASMTGKSVLLRHRRSEAIVTRLYARCSRPGFVVGAAIATGLQSAAARRLAVPGISTVALTSTLTSLVARGVAHVRHGKWAQPKPSDRPRGSASCSESGSPMRRPPAVLVWLAALAALRALHRGGMENRGGLECGLAAAGAVAVDGGPAATFYHAAQASCSNSHQTAGRGGPA
ncbi:MAG: DUF1275 family protein [Burkholderiales bacterium]